MTGERAEDRRPVAIYHQGDMTAYYAATKEQQDAWNAYANQAARAFNESGLDSYDSINTYPGMNRDGKTTPWCPPVYFPEWLQSSFPSECHRATAPIKMWLDALDAGTRDFIFSALVASLEVRDRALCDDMNDQIGAFNAGALTFYQLVVSHSIAGTKLSAFQTMLTQAEADCVAKDDEIARLREALELVAHESDDSVTRAYCRKTLGDAA